MNQADKYSWGEEDLSGLEMARLGRPAVFVHYPIYYWISYSHIDPQEEKKV